MQIAGHTLATPDVMLDDVFELFAGLGLEGIEIVQDDGYSCGIRERPDSRDLARLRGALDAHGIRAVHLTPYIRTLDSLDEAVRSDAIDRMNASIEAAAALGATGVRVLAGRKEGPARAQREARFLASLRVLAGTARAAGISLNIETKGWSFADTTANTLGLLERCDAASTGILFDPANLVLDGLDALQACRDQAGRIRHVHVKDVRAAATGDVDLVPLGRGSVPWPDLVATLHRSGYTGYFSLEHERRWHPESLPPAHTAYPIEIAYLRGLA